MAKHGTMPRNLLFVRHGQSEGNLAALKARQGDLSYIQSESFLKTPHSQYRLTNRGIEQAKLAGQWIRREFPTGFDGYFASVFIRTMETAEGLQLPMAEPMWKPDRRIIERDWGILHAKTTQERYAEFPVEMYLREVDPLIARPPNGQALSDICFFVRDFLGTLHREYTDKDVIVVCHGDVMWAVRTVLEYLLPWDFKRLYLSKNKRNGIWNLQILHYTRVNPRTGQLADYLDWFRMIRPTAPNTISERWRKIKREKFDNAGLANLVAQFPRLWPGE